jgi:hypothetical protein
VCIFATLKIYFLYHTIAIQKPDSCQLIIKENGKVVNDIKADFTTAVNLTTFKTIYNLKKSLTIKKDNKVLTIKKV